MSPSTDVADREWTVTLDGKPWASAARYEVENPTTGRPLTSAPDLSEEEVGRASDFGGEGAWCRVQVVGCRVPGAGQIDQ